jgi:hypothetical protein
MTHPDGSSSGPEYNIDAVLGAIDNLLKELRIGTEDARQKKAIAFLTAIRGAIVAFCTCKTGGSYYEFHGN